jgi:hypothetical protein
MSEKFLDKTSDLKNKILEEIDCIIHDESMSPEFKDAMINCGHGLFRSLEKLEKDFLDV